MVSEWFSLFVAATLGVMLVLDISGRRCHASGHLPVAYNCGRHARLSYLSLDASADGHFELGDARCGARISSPPRPTPINTAQEAARRTWDATTKSTTTSSG
jgi:hypothetical protein